jgi:hypothetical protein
VKLTVSVRCTPLARPGTTNASEQQPPANAAAEVSDDISPSGIKFKLALLGVAAPIESPVVPSRDFAWEAPVELVSSDAWAQQMAGDEESHVAVLMAGAAAPVVLLPLRLASLMGQEKSNTTQITVDSSALGQSPVLLSTVSVTITRHTAMLSPALMDRLNPLAITIVRCCLATISGCAVDVTARLLQSPFRKCIIVTFCTGQRLLHAEHALLVPAALLLLRSCIRRVRRLQRPCRIAHA